jgi:hypothetical protein
MQQLSSEVNKPKGFMAMIDAMIDAVIVAMIPFTSVCNTVSHANG